MLSRDALPWIITVIAILVILAFLAGVSYDNWAPLP
jgi:hypothetical protein